MKTISVSAYFDDKSIQLDEPLELEPNTRLIITVLPKQDTDREEWYNLTINNLVNVYDENEEEYSLKSIKIFNSEYESSSSKKIINS